MRNCCPKHRTQRQGKSEAKAHAVSCMWVSGYVHVCKVQKGPHRQEKQQQAFHWNKIKRNNVLGTAFVVKSEVDFWARKLVTPISFCGLQRSTALPIFSGRRKRHQKNTWLTLSVCFLDKQSSKGLNSLWSHQPKRQQLLPSLQDGWKIRVMASCLVPHPARAKLTGSSRRDLCISDPSHPCLSMEFSPPPALPVCS